MKNSIKRILVSLLCVTLLMGDNATLVLCSEIGDALENEIDEANPSEGFVDINDLIIDDDNSAITEGSEDLFEEKLTEELEIPSETDDEYEETEIVINEEEFTAEPLNGATYSLTYTVTNGEATITGYEGIIDNELYIPDSILDNTVTTIGNSAFAYSYFNENGVTLRLPNMLKTIEDDAFSECGFTGSLVIPNGVVTIGKHSFEGNCFTGDLIIPDSVLKIGQGAFSMCRNFDGSLSLPNYVTTIEDYTFYECGFTGDLNMPNGITRIGMEAFYDCGFDGRLTLPVYVESIGIGAFEQCDFSGNLDIPYGVKRIDISAFEQTGFTGDLIIPDSVFYVGDWAFLFCDSIVSFSVPSDCYIGKGTFPASANIKYRVGGDVINYVTDNGDISIGTCIEMGKYNNVPLVWKCVAITDKGPLMVCDKVISFKEYDVEGNDSTYHYVDCGNYFARIRKDYGSNCWQDSNIRQWLNSNDEIVEYTHCTPSYVDEPGFLTSFSEKELRLIKSVNRIVLLNEADYNYRGSDYVDGGSKTYYTNYSTTNFATDIDYKDYYYKELTDKIFLLNAEELGWIKANCEDDLYTSATVSAIINSGLDINYNDKVNYWTGNPHNNGGACYEWVATITESGVSGARAYDRNIGVRPAFYLVTEDDINTKQFNEAIYRANYLQDFSNQSSKQWDDYVNERNGNESPAIKFATYLIEHGASWAAAGWDFINNTLAVLGNPVKIVDVVSSNNALYEAVLLEVFSNPINVPGENYISQVSKYEKKAKDFTSAINDTLNDIGAGKYYEDGFFNNGFDITKSWSEYSSDDQKMIKEACEEAVKKNSVASRITDKADDFFRYFDAIMSEAKSIESAAEEMGQYYAIYSYTENEKEYLYDLWSNCPDSSFYLKSALKDIYDNVSLQADEFCLRMWSKEYENVGLDSYIIGFKFFWKSVKSSIYTANPMVKACEAAAKVGVYISDVAFNTSELVEAYHNLHVLAELRTVSDITYKQYYEKYQSDHTQSNAEKYLTAVDMAYMIMQADCDYTKAYIDQKEHSTIQKISDLFGDDSIALQYGFVLGRKDEYKSSYIKTQTDWLASFKNDYPEIFEKYDVREYVGNIVKEVLIACPVDIYIYDGNGVLVGSVIGHEVYASDEKISLGVMNDEKMVLFSEGCDDYNIKYVGTDEGVMDIDVYEYDENGKKAREVKFCDIPLTEGKIYTSDISNSVLKEDEYKLLESNSNLIRPNADTTPNGQLQQYSVCVENGLATDIDECSSNILSYANEYVTLAATCEDDEFYEWRVISGSEDLIIDNPSSKITKLIPGNGDCVILAITKGYYGDVLYEDFPNQDPNQIPKGLWIAGQLSSYEYDGTSIKPQVRAYDNETLLLSGKDYTISYKNNIKAYTLSEEDEGFNAKLAPSITIKSKGNYAGSETVYFKIMPADISDDAFTADRMAIKANNKAQKPVPSLLWNGKSLAAKGNYSISYYNVDETGAAVGEPLASVKDAGEYVIRLTALGTNFVGTKDIALSVTADKTLVSKLSVGKIANQTYTGSPLEPVLTIKNGKYPLTEGTDYELTYSDNTNVGKACVLIEGKGNYTGVRRVYFNITGIPLSKATVTGISTVPYTGNEIEFNDISLYIKATKTTLQKDLTEGKDYTVSYSKNVNAGTGTVIFTGINGYTGTVKKNFKITAFKLANEPDRISVEMDDSVVYSKGGAKPSVTVKFTTGDGTEKTLTEKADYSLAYSKNTAVNDCSNPKNLPTVKITLKGSYSGSISKNYSITPKNIETVSLSVNDKTYQNKKNIYASAPALTDTDGKKLAAGKDYDKTLAYTYKNETTVINGAEEVVRGAGDAVDKNDIIPAGTAIKVTATAKAGGNYSGTVSGEYRITKSSIASAKATIPAQIYSGAPITLTKDEIILKVGKDTLTSDDFEIVEGSYKNNVKKGTASLTVKGVGNYGGTKTVNFTIKTKTFIWWWKYDTKLITGADCYTVYFGVNGSLEGAMYIEDIEDYTAAQYKAVTKNKSKWKGAVVVGYKTKKTKYAVATEEVGRVVYE